MRIVVLLSAGLHPVSGRPCAARLDAQAIRLALSLGGEAIGLHAGPDADIVADYLGHGLGRLIAVQISTGADPVPALIEVLRGLRPDLVLAGRQAQGGDDTGMVPYLAARGLSLPIIADAAALSAGEAGEIQIDQALTHGARRRVTLCLPALVTVHPAAPPPLPFTAGAMRRGRIELRQGEAGVEAARPEERPYRRRPRLMTTATGNGESRLLVDPAPAAAAREILDFLNRIGIRRG